VRLPLVLFVLGLLPFFFRCNNKPNPPAAAGTGPSAAAGKKSSAKTGTLQPKGKSTPPPAPAFDDSALTVPLEETMKKSDYAPIGPVAAADAANRVAAVRKSALQGPGLCYVALASCKGDYEKIHIRVVDPEGAVVPSRPYDQGAAGPLPVVGILACPEKDGFYTLELMVETGTARCAVGLMGN
jgi:hypothetical protein